jgi:hypothetical protein
MSRVNVPGLEIVESKDNATHEVEIGKVSEVDQEILIEMIRSMMVKDRGEFFPARVFEASGKDLWRFKNENFHGVGKLVSHGNELVIILVNKHQQIEKVIPVADLPKIQRVKVGEKTEMIGGRGLEDMLTLKFSIAKKFKLDFVTTEDEKSILQFIRQAEKADEEARRVAREEARRGRLIKILSRPAAEGYTINGKICYGTPVTADEWQMLPDKSRAILVESYDDEIRICGNVIEAFFVRKSGNKTEKNLPKPISAEKPKPAEEKIPEASGIIYARVDGKIQRIMVFAKSDIELLVKKGLNSGTLVAIDGKDEVGRYRVERLEEGKSNTVGLFASLQ